MRRVVILTLCSSVLALAGLMDFETIEDANKAYKDAEYKKSAALYKKLSKDSPQRNYNMGNAYYKAKEYDKALDSYGKAKGTDEAQRLHNIGNSYFGQKELDSAIKSYEESLKIREDKDTRYNLELAKKQKEEQKRKDQQQKNDQQKQDQKKQDQEKKDQNQKEKDSDKPNQQKKGDRDQKSQQDKKDQKDKKAQEKQQKSKKDQNSKQDGTSGKEPKMSKEQQMTQKELNRLLKKLNQKKLPSMMYQAGESKKDSRDSEVNPW